MKRIRICLPRGQSAQYQHLDMLHDALINAWTAAGAPVEQVLGREAHPWHFAALGGRRGQMNETHSLVVSTPDTVLANYLGCFEAAQVRQARAMTAEMVDFSTALVETEPDPVLPGQGSLGVLLLSPLALSVREEGKKRWQKDLGTIDLAAAINGRLSRLAGRSVVLQAQPDRLYLRANPSHSVLIPIKRGKEGQRAFVIGMRAPLVLAGSDEDLRLAWYAGLGEKTRNGFGCLGLLERGVGR